MRQIHTLQYRLIPVLILIFLPVILSAQQIPQQPIEKYVLPNGMQVILREDHAIPTVSVNVVFHAGSSSEKYGETGYAHLYEHMMFEGTENIPGDYIERVQNFGGGAGGQTSKDYTLFNDYVPANFLERSLCMQSDRLANLTKSLKQERFEAERDVVKNERRQYLDNTPYSKMSEVLAAAAYPPDHPYSWETIGHMEDLDHVTLDALKNFYRRYYSPDNAALILYGDFHSAVAKVLIRKYFASIPPGPGVTRMHEWIPALSHTKRVTIEDNVDMPQVNMQWPMPPRFSNENVAANLLWRCLTFDASARLNRVLVEQTGLAVFVNAYPSADELAGEFHVDFSVYDVRNIGRVEEIIDSVLADIALNGVPESELSDVKKVYSNTFLHRLQADFTKTYFMYEYNFLLGDPDKFQWDLDRHLQLTVNDIKAFVKSYLAAKPHVVVTCVPRSGVSSDTITVDWKTLPPPNGETTFTAPTVQQAKLANGMQLLLVEKHDLPLVSAKLFVRNGWSQDPLDRWGLATMVQALIDEETASKTKDQIAGEMRKTGSQIVPGVSCDGTTFSTNVTKLELQRSLALMADILMHPVFSQEELDKKKKKFISFIRNNRYDPEVLSKSVYTRFLYGEKTSYAQSDPAMGNEASISTLTREDLLAFYRAHYSPDETAAVIVGDLTLDEAKSIFEKEFAAWRPVAHSDYVLSPEFSLKGRKIVLVDQPEATQSMLRLGMNSVPENHPDYVLINAFGATMSGMATSDRVNKILRTQKGYTYGISIVYGLNRFQGALTMYGTVQTEHTAESVQDMVTAIQDICSQSPVTEQELQAIQQSAIQMYPSMFTTNEDIAEKLLFLWRMDLPPSTGWNDFLVQVKALTVPAVTQAASKHIHPENILIVVVGDRSKIEAPLRALNLSEVVVVNPDDM